MQRLARVFADSSIKRFDRHNVPSDVKEAMGSAILANETLLGDLGNMPSAVAANRPVALGKMVPEN